EGAQRLGRKLLREGRRGGRERARRHDLGRAGESAGEVGLEPAVKDGGLRRALEGNDGEVAVEVREGGIVGGARLVGRYAHVDGAGYGLAVREARRRDDDGRLGAIDEAALVGEPRTGKDGLLGGARGVHEG